MAEELSRRAAKKAQKQREKERIRVEKAYAKAHPTPITVVTPETREEMRLTRKGQLAVSHAKGATNWDPMVSSRLMVNLNDYDIAIMWRLSA